MKILLDENIDIHFKKLFVATEHEVYTVRDLKWNGIQNGALLRLLKDNNFGCWIVVDKNLKYQQNMSALPCLIIVLDVKRNTLRHITPLLPAIIETLDNLPSERLIVISENQL